MKRICIAAIIAGAVFWSDCQISTAQLLKHNGVVVLDDGAIGRAFNDRTSDVQVEGAGVVTRVLEDDVAGSRHQRFIVRLASGQTLLVAHNIDIAPRVANLQKGDSVGFYGEYVWNDQGGIIHWTHHDPQGKHVAGWIKHNDQIYQ